jgi:hypothetical protein
MVVCQNGQINSSGCCWDAGTVHTNYAGVRCVWSGGYLPATGHCRFAASYSDGSHEEYVGRFRESGDGTCLFLFPHETKYAWSSGERRSFGRMQAVMLRLDGEAEAATARELQAVMEKKASVESFMREVGPVLAWDELTPQAAEHRRGLAKEEAGVKSFIKSPPADSELPAGKGFIVRFTRPKGAQGEGDYIALCRKGAPLKEFAANGDSYFEAWDTRVAHGILWYSQRKGVVPSGVGDYELRYFSKAGKLLASHPIRLVASV